MLNVIFLYHVVHIILKRKLIIMAILQFDISVLRKVHGIYIIIISTIMYDVLTSYTYTLYLFVFYSNVLEFSTKAIAI